MKRSLIFRGLAAFWILHFILQCHVVCEDTQINTGDGGQDDSSSYLPDKRQHNILRFGKRQSSPGHSLIRFGKRLESTNPLHSYLLIGKRDEESRNNLPALIRYLQKTQDISWKRGHNILRFGKRGDNHHFIRFGKREEDGYPFDDLSSFRGSYDDPDEQEMKRNGHSMMYFGKRGGHNMLYFGKRGGHSMLYFGKRQSPEMDYPEIEDILPENKRGPHSMIHFGKREEVPDETDFDDIEDKRAHSMIHFGKRFNENDVLSDNINDKRAHSMIHFGKRDLDATENEADLDVENDKRGTHSMLRFGRRGEEDYKEENLPKWIHQSGPLGMGEKRYHSLLRFGKRFLDSSRGEGHSMIHFGKREDGKRAHSMIHFGKRSVQEEKNESSAEDAAKPDQSSGEAKHEKRQKRQVNTEEAPTANLIHYVPEFPEIPMQVYDPNDSVYSRQYGFADNGFPEDKDYLPELQFEEMPLFFARHVRSNWKDMENDVYNPDKKDSSKNVFLRFGKR